MGATISSPKSPGILPVFSSVILIPAISLLLYNGCDSDVKDIVDPSFVTPYILSLEVTPDTINTDTVGSSSQPSPTGELELTWNVGIQVHRRGIEPFRIVYSLTSQRLGSIIVQGTIDAQDNGDLETFWTNFSFSGAFNRSDIGKYLIEVGIQNGDGFVGNSRTAIVELIRTNRPPVILSVTAPDTIQLPEPVGNEPQSTTFAVDVIVDDPDGNDDVTSVYFYSYNPAGERGPATFQLRNLGNGLFSDTLSVNSNNTRGTYRFEFRAVDRSSAVSDTVNHFITLQ